MKITKTTAMLVMRRGPQRLAGVHGAAVADQRDHRPVRQRELDADRRRQAPADAAAAQAEEALRIVAADELAHAAAGRQRFLDHHRVASAASRRSRASSASGCIGVAAMVRPAPSRERLALGLGCVGWRPSSRSRARACAPLDMRSRTRAGQLGQRRLRVCRGSRPRPDSSCRAPTDRCRDGRSSARRHRHRRRTAATG